MHYHNMVFVRNCAIPQSDGDRSQDCQQILKSCQFRKGGREADSPEQALSSKGLCSR